MIWFVPENPYESFPRRRNGISCSAYVFFDIKGETTCEDAEKTPKRQARTEKNIVGLEVYFRYGQRSGSRGCQDASSL